MISFHMPWGDKWSVRNCQQEINDNICKMRLPKAFYFVLLISCMLWSKIESNIAVLKSLPDLYLYFWKTILAQAGVECFYSLNVYLKSEKTWIDVIISISFLLYLVL